MLIKRKLTKKDLMKSLKNKQDYKRLGKNIEKALKKLLKIYERIKNVKTLEME